MSTCFYAEDKVEDVLRRFGWDGDGSGNGNGNGGKWEWFGRVNEAGKKVYEGNWRL